MNSEAELSKRRGTRILLAVLAAWGLAVVVAAETGAYAAVNPRFLAAIIALGIVVPVIGYALSSGFRGYIQAMGLRSLTAFHVWRIAAALVFFWYGAHDLLPEAFVRNAGWGDLIAGFLALAVLLLPESRGRYLTFHVLGFTDFVVAVGTGLTFFLRNDPRMSAIETLPMALIPLYGVGISGASHIMAFDLLRRSAVRRHEGARRSASV
ncbi:hypothetical protein [Dyella sp. EPa41]|uniref:hypothetical protein n=1 Tax=Dyella sp. EPa41 TaxID=1561194 RepID=UPI001914F2D5|nr:hypothetical protein [Dyella sp. EPa41]